MAFILFAFGKCFCHGYFDYAQYTDFHRLFVPADLPAVRQVSQMAQV
jgi:hypothetical protein